VQVYKKKTENNAGMRNY